MVNNDEVFSMFLDLQIHIEISSKIKNKKKMLTFENMPLVDTCDWSNCFSKSSVSFGVITEE